jgi:transcriptional regulator with XRE-family HTH domain
VRAANAKQTGSVRGVLGERIRFAREQQEMTMGMVRVRGGPSKGYQSDVENGNKSEVRAPTLSRWVRVLKVTHAFVRGEIPHYHSDPDACRGLALDVGDSVRSHLCTPEWQEMTALDMQRQVMSLVATTSKQVPRAVLAYVLNLDLVVLDKMIQGEIPIPKEQIAALAGMTRLSEALLMGGPLDDADLLQGYLEALHLAHQKRIPPSELRTLVENW